MGSITRRVFRVGAAALVALLAASTSAEVHRFTEETLTADVREGDVVASDQPHPRAAVGEPFSAGLGHLRGQTLRDISLTMLGQERGPDLPAEIRFEDLLGDVVLVHVWATWCAPCLAKMPGLEAMQERYRHRGLTILNVSDEPADILLDWLEQNPSAMLHARRSKMSFLAGPGADARAGVPRPVYLVLDRAGVVRVVLVGAMSAVGPEEVDGSVDYLMELVERHL